MGLFRRQNVNPRSESDDRISKLLSELDLKFDEIDRAESPRSFFSAYKDAITICGAILSYKPGDVLERRVLETLRYLFCNKTEITDKFLDRLSTGGRLSYDVDELVQYKDEMTDDSYAYFVSLTGLHEMYFTYCTVSFGPSRTYDYICEIPDISVGDDVIVPVGEEETEKLARVTAIKEYRYDEVPYPVAKTKKIIAKYGCGL